MIAERAERTRHLRVEITPDLHRKLKMRAVKEDSTVTAMVIGTLEREYSDEQNEQKGER